MDLRIGNTTLNFKDALLEDKKSPNKTWGAASLYTELGFYYNQVLRYLNVFPHDQICILLLEDLKKDPTEVIRKIYRFIGVDENFIPDLTKKHNAALIPRNSFLNRLMMIGALRVKIRKLLKGTSMKSKLKKLIYTQPEISNEDEHEIQTLKGNYQEDIRKLAKLINRDLSMWS
jgi:hypothetical protein